MTTRAQPARTILTRCPVVPVVVLDDPALALPLGEALLAGGINIVEITLRTSAGLDAIGRLADMSGLHVGAGSVLVAEQVESQARYAKRRRSPTRCCTSSPSVAWTR